jgi:ADP-dependent phosphofructokinase/glucokinase
MNARIALGFGNNIDYEIEWDSAVIENLVVKHDITSNELDIHRAIQSERDLVISILSFLKQGIGGERFVASSNIIEGFSKYFEKQTTLGGTSVRAAIAMRKFGYKSVLHLVTVNDHVRRLIPHDSVYVCSNSTESLHPHLIVQFSENTCVRANNIDISASQSNRLIYHSDSDNIAMQLDERFADFITSAEVLLVSGFNAMQSASLLRNRLACLLQMMKNLPHNALVFYEDGGFYEPKFSQLIYRTLASQINIFSLNEDELQDYLGRRLDLLDVAQIECALAALQKLIPVPVIVVHTKHWALAYGIGATRFKAALKAGTTMATTRFCYGDDFTSQDYVEIENLPSAEANAKFANAINELAGDNLYCVPVADVGHVDQFAATTVGLGDAFVGGFLPALLDD